MTRDEDFNLVELLLRADPVRWMAGILGGLFGAFVMFAVVGVASKSAGGDILYLSRVFALPLVGPSAMDYEVATSAIVTGTAFMAGFFAFLGLVFAQVTGTYRIPPLLGMGFTWGVFGWVFISNLYSPSFPAISTEQISSQCAFLAWMAFGFSLVSVSVFDRILRRQS